MSSNSNQQKHVRVGVGVLIKDPLNPNHIFAGIRKGSHGSGTLALPGGHLEMYESWEDCAKREVDEETSLILKTVKFGHVTNDVMKCENKHYITIFMMGECSSENDKPVNMEPNKCEGWKSFGWDDMKDIANGKHESGLSLFGPLLHLVEESSEAIVNFIKS
mmetsp:Transcript_26171/g.32256  ORF Transcript_26171/g.32256 Transcript_26171/m.32256 type:complete len:162 (-) Transcript_26171:37-522(-)